MTVAHVEVLVEERSMEAALREFLPRILGDLTFEVYPFLCKNDLLLKLPHRLRGYRSWLPEDWRIVVVVDRDDDDCIQLKRQMEWMALEANMATRSAAKDGTYTIVNRLAIEELEAWYFGDWDAVRAAYPRVSENIPRKSAFREADAIQGGTWEAFEGVMKKAGYFRTGLRKIEAARTIARHWCPDSNTSRSFQVFCDVLKEMAAARGA